MKTLKKITLLTLLPTIMVGCGGGNDINSLVNRDVPKSKSVLPTKNKDGQTKKPQYQKISVASSPNDRTIMGVSFESAYKGKDGAVTSANITAMNKMGDPSKYTNSDPNKIEITIGGTKDTLAQLTAKYTKNAISDFSLKEAPSEMTINYDSSTYGLLRAVKYKHVQAGVMQQASASDVKTAIFYSGDVKTTNTPIAGTATYNGFWEYGYQVNNSETGEPINIGASGPIYYERGSDPIAIKNTATFTADFGTKKLTGKLKSDTHGDNTPDIQYTVNADINGNSFSGEAKGSYHLKNLSGSGTTDATVEGSFFGDKAEELAGYIAANDKAFAGVFAAKLSKQTGLKTDGDLIHAGIMKFEASHTVADNSSINFSGDRNKVQIDGTVIDFTPPTENKELQFVQFGQVSSGSDTYFFVQGEVTPMSQVPTSNTAEYKGHWSGYGQESALFSKENMNARFKVDWGTKKLEGGLFNENQDDSNIANAQLHFTAKISGNTFTGTTDNMKLLVDTSKDTVSSQKITGKANVSGHFYGTDANELGGTIHKADKSFGAVFGAKKFQ